MHFGRKKGKILSLVAREEPDCSRFIKTRPLGLPLLNHAKNGILSMDLQTQAPSALQFLDLERVCEGFFTSTLFGSCLFSSGLMFRFVSQNPVRIFFPKIGIFWALEAVHELHSLKSSFFDSPSLYG